MTNRTLKSLKCFIACVAVLVTMFAAGPPADAAKVFEYRLGEGLGTLVADSSGNQIDASLTSTPDYTAPNWTNGYSGSGLEFDGVGDLLWLDDQPLLDVEHFTLMSWVNYAPSPDPEEKRIEVMEKAGAYWMNIRMDSRKMRLGGFFGTEEDHKWVFLDTTSAIPEGTWTHVAGTFDGTRLTTYINGNPSSTKSVSRPTAVSNDQPLIIGAKFIVSDTPASDESTALFNGSLDEVRVFDEALTASQILQYASLPVLAGDFNEDFDVDGADFLKWQRGESTFALSQSDLDDWQAGFATATGTIAAVSTSVPEPSTGLMLFSLLLFMGNRAPGKLKLRR